MKSFIPLLLFLVISKSLYCQDAGELFIYSDPTANGPEIKLSIEKGTFQKVFVFESKESSNKKADGDIIQLNEDKIKLNNEIFNCEDKELNKNSTVFYKFNCKENYIEFYLKKDSVEVFQNRKVWYCVKNQKFYISENDFKANCKTAEKLSLEKTKTDYSDIFKIPYPKFNLTDNIIKDFDRQNRVLYIDANPLPSSNLGVRLVKIKKLDENSNKKGKVDCTSVNVTANHYYEKEAKAVSTSGNIAVFLKNYNTTNIEKLSVVIDGSEYEYNKGLNEILEGLKKNKQTEEETQQKDSVKSTSTGNDLKKVRTEYLKNVINYFNSIPAITTNDIVRLESYKDDLRRTMADKDKKIELNAKGEQLLALVLSWSPNYLGLTPISPAILDKDEVVIKVISKFSGQEQNEVTVGSYRTIGGLSVDLGGAFFITGLKNNNVYTETNDVNGSEELRAKINNKNQKSIGYGLNTEVSFRTGALIRPTLNIAAFVPFEEDITPYLAVGPGISIQTQKVKFSLLGGLAYGSVNSIKEQYIEKDLASIENLSNTDLVEKIWDSSWFLGIGIRYYFKEKKE